MISARGAEKLAIKFFSDMGHSVEDVAAYQVTQQSDTWKQGDIRIDSQYLLDVKNARNALNSDVYSEFCVPKFKQIWIDENYRSDVFIVAVLSPYLKSRYVIDMSSTHFHVKNPCVLGVSSAEQLKRLEDDFADNALSINLRRNPRKGIDPKKYLPPWLFDYSTQFYREQNEIKHTFLHLKDSEIPDWEDLCLAGELPTSLFIAARKPIPVSWVNHIPVWQMDFINLMNSIRGEKVISLPYLFLSLLKHFLIMLSREDSSYSPQKYVSLLYTGRRSDYPLKLYDPLNIIRDFCETLQLLWDRRDEMRLSRFKVFNFTGRGLLKGQQSHSDPNWTTLLAYCGGYVEGKGKCGYAPLVIGQHYNCIECGHLICPEENCQDCKHNCPEHEKRLHSRT